MEYQEPLNVTINVSGTEYFHLHTFAVYSAVSPLVILGHPFGPILKVSAFLGLLDP
jgi:hypothetical protein